MLIVRSSRSRQWANKSGGHTPPANRNWITVNVFFKKTVAGFSHKSIKGKLLAAIGLTLSMAAAQATAQDSGSTPQGAITVPEDVTYFAKNDPNNRRATAVVNGDIITGTDVDQRVALVLASNKAQPSDEEKQRLKFRSCAT